MNSINNFMNQYSKDINDYGTYMAPIGTMAVDCLTGSPINTISSACAVLMNQVGLKSAEYIEKNKTFVNRSVAVLAGVAVTTLAQSQIYGPSGNNLAIALLSNLGLFIVTAKTVETVNPVRIIPYVRLPASIALACVVGEVAREVLKGLNFSQSEINNAGGFMTLLAVCSVALNDLVYKKTETVFVDKPAGTQILKDLSQVRQLKDGRFLVLPNKK
jgi:hypothetical protein